MRLGLAWVWEANAARAFSEGRRGRFLDVRRQSLGAIEAAYGRPAGAGVLRGRRDSSAPEFIRRPSGHTR